MRFTIAEFIVTQTHVELDKPNAYHAYGIPFFFKYTRTSISDVEQTTPLRNMDRTAYLTFEDRSVVVIARWQDQQQQTYTHLEDSRGTHQPGRQTSTPC